MKIRRTRGLGLVALSAAFALAITGCSTAGHPAAADDSSGSTAPYMVAKKSGPLRVGFSNSFAGNAWRTQMIAELKYAVKGKYKKDVSKLTVTDANNSVSTQLSQINDLLSSGIDILLIDAASSTALNSAVKRAHRQGVMVVSFDTAATSPNGVIVNPDQEELGHNAAEFLAKQLKPGDTVVTLDGIAGSPINAERLKGVKAVFKKAGIKIVGSATTNWDQAQGQSATVNLLTAHPNVNAIYSQSGGVSLGALNAMNQMGHPVIPITGGDSYNGFLKAWKKLKDENGFSSYASSNLPEMSVTALKVAIEAVRGKDPGHLVKDVPPVVTNENLDKYVRPDLSDSLWLPTTLPESVLEKQYKK